jgi:hypothetical protein
MDRVEKNKLIAEFMGAKQAYIPFVTPKDMDFHMYGVIECIEDGENEKTLFLPEEMEFDTSWDWLMPVVEKIESLGFDVFINTCVCRITDVGQDVLEDIETFDYENKKRATYQAVVQFIIWYNQNK